MTRGALLTQSPLFYQKLKRWKYRTYRNFSFETGFRVAQTVETPFLVLYGYDDRAGREGLLYIRKGYAWDGCSGPTWDDRTNMRGGLVHDALYQFMREGLLPSSYRKEADDLFKKILLADGMCSIRADYYHWAVRNFAQFAAKPTDTPDRPEQRAP